MAIPHEVGEHPDVMFGSLVPSTPTVRAPSARPAPLGALALVVLTCSLVACEGGRVTEPGVFPDANTSGGQDAGAQADAEEIIPDAGFAADAEPVADAGEEAPDAEPAPDGLGFPDAIGFPDAPTFPDAMARDAAAAPDAGPPPSGCGNPARSGTTNESITVGNTSRDFQLVVPGNYDPNRAYPLVFGFHGQGWTMDGFRMASTSLVNAAANGAIFVFPQGLPGGGGTGWDIGSANSRDIALVDALRTWVGGRLCVDTSRVFAFGRSYGGFFVNALACARGSTLRGAAVMMSGGPYFNCASSAPWWGTHNQDDGTVPFNYGTQSRDFWVRANGCGNQTQPVGPGPCVAYQNCRAGTAVHWCPNASGAHTPANYSNTAIWAFFESL